MKIAVWHNLPSGGGKRALFNHVRGLVKRGHKIESWCLDTADHSYLSLSDFGPEHIRHSGVNDQSPKGFAGRFAPSYHDAIGRMRAFDQACKRCAEEIESGDFDLLFANTAQHYYMPYVMRYVRIPSVLYLQEPCRFMYEASPMLPWVSGAPQDLYRTSLFRPREFLKDYARLQTLRVQATQEWFNARACDLMLVNSYFSRESVLRAYGVDAKVCYLGIDTDLFRNLGIERERFIVGLGSFDSIKGIDLAVRAVSLLPEPRPPLVWIANSGNETYKSMVSGLARSLGVELRVAMAISDSDLVTTLNKAALLLYTSKLEPFGFAPLEANACGVPVVGIAEGGIRETIRDGVNGFLVEPEAESIACAASELLENPDLARQMGETAALHVQAEWGVGHSVDRLERFLLQAVSSKSNQPLKARETKSVTPEAPGPTVFAQVESTPDQSEAPNPSRPAMCTIIAKNYLALARTLAQSFLSLHPDHKCYVLIVDDYKGYIEPSEECFEIVDLADLEIPNLPNLCFKYNVRELCTAVKARLLEYLICEKSVDKLLYLDPDILVTGRLDGIYDRLRTHDIVLTPHLDTAYPDDDLMPDDGYILRAGLFNLGFIGVNSSRNVRSFLDWWKPKLYNKCVVDLLNGYFVDQKFIDFVPLFFRNVFIETGVGYNVAYWNLHSRVLSRTDGLWKCNAEPLYFFHFSGHSPRDSGSIEITNYLRSRSRPLMANSPVLQELFSEYSSKIRMNEHERARAWPYSYGYFKTGRPIPDGLRHFYRNSPARWERYGNPFESRELEGRASIDTNSRKNAASPGRFTTQLDAWAQAVHPTYLTPEEQLDAILNSRAWRWVCRYGRLKNRYVAPAYESLRYVFGRSR